MTAPIAAVTAHPNPTGLPGSNVLQQLVNGAEAWALAIALLGAFIGAALWAVASHSHNHHYAARGRMAALISGRRRAHRRSRTRASSTSSSTSGRRPSDPGPSVSAPQAPSRRRDARDRRGRGRDPPGAGIRRPVWRRRGIQRMGRQGVLGRHPPGQAHQGRQEPRDRSPGQGGEGDHLQWRRHRRPLVSARSSSG